ncbi:MAG: hypothetical protein E6248_15720 [Clostridium sp.]|uniref:hypothetical protein n=1 Tax=Clostridium sp. TaxID=1506 RepID=UPI00290A44A6|nr:hypothetical protein [Clostridium sp.]MDU5111884.1 hypothetical protein [Clostridium sp.]
MKKIFKSATFWFFIASIAVIIINITGNDDKNILLIGLNPILNFAVYTEPFRSIAWNDGPNLFMYIAHLLTFIFPAAIIDFIIYAIKYSIKKSISLKIDH